MRIQECGQYIQIAVCEKLTGSVPCTRDQHVRDTIPVLCEYSFLWIREQVICDRSGDFDP